MPKELTDDTKEALAKQGGIVDPDTTGAQEDLNQTPEGDLPDITLGDPGDKSSTGDTVPDKSGSEGDADPAGDTTSELDKQLSKTLADAGYKEEDLAERLKKDDGISDELVAELKEKLDPAFVDAHVARLRAEYKLAKFEASEKYETIRKQNEKTAEMNRFIFDSVGGEDKFNIMGKVLKDKMSPNELALLNAKLASGNKDVIREGLDLAVKKYNNIRGMGGKLMEGDAGTGVEPKAHLTKAEYRAIMKTEKYKTDPIYQRKIDEDRLRTRKADAERYGNGSYYGYHPDKGRYSL